MFFIMCFFPLIVFFFSYVYLGRELLTDSDDFGDFAAFRSGSPSKIQQSDDDSFFNAFQSNTGIQAQQVKLSHHGFIVT